MDATSSRASPLCAMYDRFMEAPCLSRSQVQLSSSPILQFRVYPRSNPISSRQTCPRARGGTLRKPFRGTSYIVFLLGDLCYLCERSLSSIIRATNWQQLKTLPDTPGDIMQALMEKGITSRAETQRRWDSKSTVLLVLLCASASPRESLWFRPKAGLGSSAFICGSKSFCDVKEPLPSRRQALDDANSVYLLFQKELE